MGRRRSPWGSVRKLPSGRYQARYRLDGVEYAAPGTFRTRSDANSYLAAVRADYERGSWVDPWAGRVALADFARRWLDERPALRPRTRELYESELKLHILPELGEVEVGSLTTARVRAWHAGMLTAGHPGPSTVAKCYRLLRSILATAVEDGLIVKNPCIIKGAGVEHHAERPIATVEEVFRLAAAIEPRLRTMVLLGAFCGLRLGELLGLRRASIDLGEGTVNVVDQVQELAGGGHFRGPPKSDAGRRTVSIPQALLPAVRAHLDERVGPEPEALVFGRTSTIPLRRGTFYAAWHDATRAAGLTQLRFHDLRHTGNTLSAATGASTRELMARMGHSSPRAALIYQHATRERDTAIARALSETILRAVPSLDVDDRTTDGSAAG